MKKALWKVALVASGFVILMGCAGDRQHAEGEGAHEGAMEAPAAAPATQPANAPTNLSTMLEAKSDSSLEGTADFMMHGDQLMVTVKVENAPPGEHAVHIHEVGDCSSPDGKSAGGHFNPGGHAHGGPDAPEHHAGDLGNMMVGEDGTGTATFHSADLTLAPGDYSVVGRALVIHEKADDFTSQPTGAAGGRIGCGVIQGS